MDSHPNAKEIIGFLWIPMEMVMKSLDSHGFQWKCEGNDWIPMDSYGNGKGIIGFLWSSMEMVRKSLDSYGFLWKC
jgi:hypothetical protein